MMKKFAMFLFIFCVLLLMSACANNETPVEPPITNPYPLGIIEFFGETYLIDEAYDIAYDDDGNITFVLFNNIGFIGLEDENAEPVYRQVSVGQVIGSATVAEGTSMGFDFINGKWELTESDVRFTGSMEFIGELTKTPEGGTLTFTAAGSESGFMPKKYGDDGALRFALEGYDPEDDFPELFGSSDTVYVKAAFSSIRLFKTERATGMNYATLIGIEQENDNPAQEETPFGDFANELRSVYNDEVITALNQRLDAHKDGTFKEMPNHHPAYPSDFPAPSRLPSYADIDDVVIAWKETVILDSATELAGAIYVIVPIGQSHIYILDPAKFYNENGSISIGFGYSSFADMSIEDFLVYSNTRLAE